MRQGSEIAIQNDTIHLPFLGKTFLIQIKNRQLSWLETSDEPTFQEGLIALSYLVNLKPIDLSKRWISPMELPGGRTFFSNGSHPPKTDAILRCWNSRHPEFIATLKRLDGTFIPTGDEGVEIPCLPLVPFRYIFYEGDVTLPSTVTLLVNATIHLFFSPDVLWALINLVDHVFLKDSA